VNIAIPIHQMLAFVLVLFRVAGIVFSAPVFSGSAMPTLVKTALALAAAVLFFPIVYSESLVIPGDPFLLVLAIGGELTVGIGIGLLGQVITAAMQLGGSIIGFHMGLRIANVLDPHSEETISLVAAFFNLITALILLSLDFHIVILRIVKESCALIRPLGMSFELGVGEVIIRAGADIFVFAVQVAAPVFAALFLVEIIMAVLAKTARQFNILMLQFPIKILLGAIFLSITMKVMPRAVEGMYRHMIDQISLLFRMLG
jgi:flagellar biosynthetic protein FliR